MRKLNFDIAGIKEIKSNEIRKYEGGFIFIAGALVVSLGATLAIKAMDYYDHFYCKANPEKCTSYTTEHHPGGFYVPAKS